MRSTRKIHWKIPQALALGVATAAIFATTASAGVGTGPIPGQYSADLEAEQAMIQAPFFSKITNPAQLYAGKLEPANAVNAALANQSARDGGPVFMNGVPDGYVGSGVEQDDLSSVGVTPTNLARTYHPIEQGVAQPDGFQPQLQGDEQVIIRDRPDGFQPQTKTVESATVSASSESLDRGDLALGFGLGLILATAAAIALAMTRDRQRTGIAHS